VVAVSLAAAIGDVGRFAAPERLVASLGLNPSVHQSGDGPVRHGRITKQGRGQARGMLVEAAWAAARSPGPLRAFFLRISACRGQHVAAVATARKMAIVIWHMLRDGKDYTWARPALHAKKLRDLELRAGHQPRRGQRGAAHAYTHAATREAERRQAAEGEAAYERLTKGWQPKGPRRARMDTAKEERPWTARRGFRLQAPLFATRSPTRGRK
jgi:hypothetical protein